MCRVYSHICIPEGHIHLHMILVRVLGREREHTEIELMKALFTNVWGRLKENL